MDYHAKGSRLKGEPIHSTVLDSPREVNVNPSMYFAMTPDNKEKVRLANGSQLTGGPIHSLVLDSPRDVNVLTPQCTLLDLQTTRKG